MKGRTIRNFPHRMVRGHRVIAVEQPARCDIPDLLVGAWRDDTPIVAAPVTESRCRGLADAGVLGLLADRLMHHSDQASSSARAIRWQQAIGLTVQRHVVVQLVQELHGTAVHPILLKGIATSRWYPFPGARPVGDIDLLLRPSELPVAVARLTSLGYRIVARFARPSQNPVVVLADDQGTVVDLQTDLWPLPHRDTEEAFLADTGLAIQGTTIRILPREVELRFAAIHAAKHGFSRAIWSVDVAATMEGAVPVDWERVMAGPKREREWIIASLGVAARLLGARLPSSQDMPPGESMSWLDRAVLARWTQGPVVPGRTRDCMQAIKGRDIRGAATALAASWPDGLEALTRLWWSPHRLLIPAAMLVLVAQRGRGCVRAAHPGAFPQAGG